MDEGKITWDDKVIDHLPDFRMMDPWVTREFTIRDLLTHRSGLGAGAGDLMLWPEPSGFSRDEILHNLRHLKPVSSFRSDYAYDNLLYIVAGEIVPAVTGQSWEEFVQTRILNPLQMGCYSGDAPMEALGDVATPHSWLDGKQVTVPRNAITGKATVSAAAGGMVCNVRGMATWMLTQLEGGVSLMAQGFSPKHVATRCGNPRRFLALAASTATGTTPISAPMRWRGARLTCWVMR